MSETTTSSTMTPKALAEELDIDPKRLRGWLRGSEYAREAALKGTNWAITAEVADAARAKFAKADEKADADEATAEATEEVTPEVTPEA